MEKNYIVYDRQGCAFTVFVRRNLKVHKSGTYEPSMGDFIFGTIYFPGN